MIAISRFCFIIRRLINRDDLSVFSSEVAGQFASLANPQAEAARTLGNIVSVDTSMAHLPYVRSGHHTRVKDNGPWQQLSGYSP
ncbi:hypothetical protein [Ruegeria halocynthiae]|uniref:hypothetical protein n=1 Tax=Ruegeria halocynthiae TaxID=985054 RepID=UPI000A728002|nr:hypothetical protein [Ruegeria halocynthiae]